MVKLLQLKKAVEKRIHILKSRMMCQTDTILRDKRSLKVVIPNSQVKIKIFYK